MYSTGLRAHEFTFGSLFKIMYAASLIFWVLLGVLFGVAAYFGAETVSFNGSHLTGLGGLIGGILITTVLGAIFGALGSALAALAVKFFGAAMPIGVIRSTKAVQSDGA